MSGKKNILATVSAPQVLHESIDAEIDRGSNLRGKQDDHTTAFAVLTKVLDASILLKETTSEDESDKIRVTPIIEAIYELAKREINVLKEYDLINIDKIINELIDICPADLKEEVSKLDVRDQQDKAQNILEKFGKYCEEHSDINFQTAYLLLYSKFLFYQESENLVKDLEKEIESIHKEANERAEELVSQLDAAFNNLKKEASEISKLPGKVRQNIKETLMSVTLPYVQDMHARKSTENILEKYAEHLNKLAFATFKPVGDTVSSRSRHAGSCVSSAMEQFAQECKSGNVRDAAINMALLLDFYPLSKQEIEKLEEDKKQTILGKVGDAKKARMQTRAKDLSLTRDNNSDVFSYVVARHWHYMCNAFPDELGRNSKIEDIKESFIQHMLIRWRYADLNSKESSKVPKGSTGFQQEYNEIQEKQKQSNASRWEATEINEDDCKVKIKAMIQSYQSSSGFSFPRQLTPVVSQRDSFWDNTPSIHSSPIPTHTQDELQERIKTLEFENSTLKARLFKLEQKDVQASTTMHTDGSSSSAQLMQQSFTEQMAALDGMEPTAFAGLYGNKRLKDSHAIDGSSEDKSPKDSLTKRQKVEQAKEAEKTDENSPIDSRSQTPSPSRPSSPGNG